MRNGAAVSIGSISLVVASAAFLWRDVSTGSAGTAGTRGSPPILVAGFRPMGMGIQDNRFFATLAAPAGPWVVSVCQELSDDHIHDLFSAQTIDCACHGGIELLLQVWSRVPGESVPPRLIPSTVRVVAEPGHTTVTPVSVHEHGPRAGRVPSRSYTLRFEAVPRQARVLSILSGTIVGGSPARAFAFRITNVPLPNVRRIFGRVTFRSAPGSALAPHSGRAMWVAHIGTASSSLAAHSSPLPDATMWPAAEIALASGCRPGRVWLPILPPGVPAPSISARHLRLGRMSTTVDWCGHHWTGSPWEDETVAVPGPGGLVMFFRLTRSAYERPVVVAPRPPFPVPPDVCGCALRGSVAIGSRPFGPGSVLVNIARRNADGSETARLVQVPLARDGTYTLPDLEAGTYRVLVRPTSPVPRHEFGDASYALGSYLRARYGVPDGAAPSGGCGEFTLADGRVGEVAPLQLAPRACVAISSQP